MTHTNNKKAHGKLRERFSFLDWCALKFSGFRAAKESENAFYVKKLILYLFDLSVIVDNVV